LVHNLTMVSIEERTLNWVNRVVIGLNLCPFANAVVKSGDLAIHTETSGDMATVLASLAAHCDTVLQGSERSTALVVLANGFEKFDNFLDLVELTQSLLAELELEGHLQIATFHPHYQFSDSPYDDAANFTNRSPYPMLHILQEESVEKAVLAYPNTDAIYQRNIDLLRGMEPDQLNLLITDENNQHEQ